MFGIRSRVAAAIGLAALTATTALLPASSFAASPRYVALRNGTSTDPVGLGPQDLLDIRLASTAVDAEAVCSPFQTDIVAVIGNSPVFANSPADNQLWELRPTGEKFDGADFVNIINKNSQLALQGQLAPPRGRQASVIQEPLAGDDVQKWLEFSPNGGHGLVFKNKATGMVLDATCSVESDFSSVVQAPENDNPSQLWFFL